LSSDEVWSIPFSYATQDVMHKQLLLWGVWDIFLCRCFFTSGFYGVFFSYFFVSVCVLAACVEDLKYSLRPCFLWDPRLSLPLYLYFGHPLSSVPSVGDIAPRRSWVLTNPLTLLFVLRSLPPALIRFEVCKNTLRSFFPPGGNVLLLNRSPTGSVLSVRLPFFFNPCFFFRRVDHLYS